MSSASVNLYEIQTDMDPNQLTGVALRTYRKWIAFALGRTSLGGHKLRNPTGSYAASIQWRRTGSATIEIFTDSPVGEMLEHGRPSYSMKSMLGSGNTKISKAGYRYRTIPIGQSRVLNNLQTNYAMSLLRGSDNALMAKAGKMWLTQSKVKVTGKAAETKLVTMSDKPGSASWQIPAFRPYAPAKCLADLLAKGKL